MHGEINVMPGQKATGKVCLPALAEIVAFVVTSIHREPLYGKCYAIRKPSISPCEFSLTIISYIITFIYIYVQYLK